MYIVQLRVYSVSCQTFHIQWKVYSLQFIVYSVQWLVHTVQGPIHRVLCTVHSVQYTVCSVQITVNIELFKVHSVWHFTAQETGEEPFPCLDHKGEISNLLVNKYIILEINWTQKIHELKILFEVLLQILQVYIFYILLFIIGWILCFFVIPWR